MISDASAAAKETSLAAQMIARLWSATLPVYRKQSSLQSFVHLPQLFAQSFIESLSLPLGEQKPLTQSIALVDDDFHREMDIVAAQEAYANKPRTRVYEGIDVRSDGWFSLVSLQFARLTRCRVVCTLYESNAGDSTLGSHVDAWFGAIVQMHGCKTWTLWHPEAKKPIELMTRPGDVLLMPPTVEHSVATPNYSVHLVFAIIDNEPIIG
jgi:Cupin superfamily protein